ncbi:15648_t:CDS:1, partial [Dentiscutata heterogama]
KNKQENKKAIQMANADEKSDVIKIVKNIESFSNSQNGPLEKEKDTKKTEELIQKIATPMIIKKV